MYVKKLILKDFRNYGYQTVNFSKTTNIICGNNANGKTNILEAIYLFGHGKSHRAHSDSEMINFDKNTASVTVCFEGNNRDFEAVMTLRRDGKKIITVNNVPITKLSRLMSYLKVVLFSPEDLSIVKGSPSRRRRFMDAAICRMYPSYFSALSEFHKAASEKNGLLREMRKKGSTDYDYLSVWNDRIADTCEKIMEYRKNFIDGLSKYAADIQKNISGEKLAVSYEPNLKHYDKQSIFEYLEKNRQHEIDFAAMRYGIQRDDIAIITEGLDARLYASQGQQRTAALSLKIAEADYMFAESGEYPVLLLDDILSELDLSRRMYLWEKIEDKQVLITCTDTDFFENKNGTKLFTVANNCITETSSGGGDADVSSSR